MWIAISPSEVLLDKMRQMQILPSLPLDNPNAVVILMLSSDEASFPMYDSFSEWKHTKDKLPFLQGPKSQKLSLYIHTHSVRLRRVSTTCWPIIWVNFAPDTLITVCQGINFPSSLSSTPLLPFLLLPPPPPPPPPPHPPPPPLPPLLLLLLLLLILLFLIPLLPHLTFLLPLLLIISFVHVTTADSTDTHKHTQRERERERERERLNRQ